MKLRPWNCFYSQDRIIHLCLILVYWLFFQLEDSSPLCSIVYRANEKRRKKESTLPSVTMKQDTPCESSTIIKLTFLDFCTSYLYRSTMLLKIWWPNLIYFIYLLATFFLLGSARYRLGISMGSLRKYPLTVVPNHPQNHSSDIQTHKLPYSLGLSRPKCDYPKNC